MLLIFEKYQALGNDFIILDETHELKQAGNAYPSVTAEQCQLLCDRHFGVGADGILSLFRSQSTDTEIYMHVLNADGSVAAMCGNGARCAVEWIKNRSKVTSLSGNLQTDSGVRKFSHDGHSIEFDMGFALITEKKKVRVEERDFEGILVNVGNDHFVIPQLIDRKSAERLVSPLTQSFTISNGPNIGFVNVTAADELELLVYERGVGFTLACGSGACAAVAACYSEGLISGTSISVSQPGGRLEIKLNDSSAGLALSMVGQASRVFSGAIQI